MFPVTSRYHKIKTKKMKTAVHHEIIYLKRRFLPPPVAGSAVLAEHVVSEGERLDNITARTLGDPEQFWRLCDANGVMHPNEMTAEIGRRLHIPLNLGG